MYSLFAHHADEKGSLLDSLNIFQFEPASTLDHCLVFGFYSLLYGALAVGVGIGLRVLARRAFAKLDGLKQPEVNPQTMGG